MRVGVDGVRAPVDDELALRHRQRVGPHPPPPHRVLVAERPGRGADGPVELRGAQAVEEPPVQAARLELAHRAVIAVGQDRLRPVARGGDRREPVRDGVDRLVPRDGLELALALGPDPLHRRHQPVGAVDPIEVAGHLLAEEPAREGVFGIALQLDGHAVPDGHPHAAGVGAVERADVLEDGRLGGGHGVDPRWMDDRTIRVRLYSTRSGEHHGDLDRNIELSDALARERERVPEGRVRVVSIDVDLRVATLIRPSATFSRPTGRASHGSTQPSSSGIGLPALSLTGRPVTGAMFSLTGIEAEGLEDGRVDVLDGGGLHGVLDSLGIGHADRLAAPQAAAGQGQAEAGGPVVAAAEGVDLGGPAELAAADDDRPVEELAPLPGRGAGRRRRGRAA